MMNFKTKVDKIQNCEIVFPPKGADESLSQCQGGSHSERQPRVLVQICQGFDLPNENYKFRYLPTTDLKFSFKSKNISVKCSDSKQFNVYFE